MINAVRQIAKSKKEHRHLNSYWSPWQAVVYISSGGWTCIFFSLLGLTYQSLNACLFLQRIKKWCVFKSRGQTGQPCRKESPVENDWKARGNLRLHHRQMGCVECTVPWLHCVAGRRMTMSARAYAVMLHNSLVAAVPVMQEAHPRDGPDPGQMELVHRRLHVSCTSILGTPGFLKKTRA